MLAAAGDPHVQDLGLCPWTGPDVATSIPWVTHSLADKFLTDMANNGGNGSSVAQALSAMKCFLEKVQHQTAENFLGMHCPGLIKLKHKNSAVEKSKDNSKQHKLVKSCVISSATGQVLEQEDPKKVVFFAR